MLDLLKRARKLSGTAGPRTLLAGRRLLAHNVGVQVTGAFLREMVRPGILRTLVDDHIDDLRNDVARTLNDDGIADADVAAVAQLLAIAANALDVVLVVQRDILHDDAANADRVELANRRKRAGAPDLDLDVLKHSHGAFGRKFMRDRPARRSGDEAKPLPPVNAIDLVDDTVDVIVKFGPLLLDLTMKGDELIGRTTQSGERIGLEATRFEPLDHGGLRLDRHFAHLAPGISEKTERARSGDRRIFLTQRTGGGIARIREDGVARRFLPLIEREKGLLSHIDLAAHLTHCRHALALQFMRHILERAYVGRDVFAFGAVTARGSSEEFSVLITQRH